MARVKRGVTAHAKHKKVLKSMIPKSGYRFSEKIMLKCN